MASEGPESEATPPARVCATCGGRIADVLGAQCPRCLLNFASTLGLEDDGVSSALLNPFQVRTFGDYELLEEVARGGMGVVYRARQISLGREVAVKMLLAGELASKESLRMFQREAQAGANLHHPNIVPVFEIGEHEAQPYFAMRFVPGGRTIAGWAAERRGDARALALAVAQAARAVAHAHAHGVLHRDLKPSNILWDFEAGPQITDFGLAKLLGTPATTVTLNAKALGSPSYMAPEQAGGNLDRITTATDVYGLGAVLYEMLAGRPPFAGASVIETMRRVAEEEPASLPGVPKDLHTVCLKCLAKKPEHRYASADALADDLERFARGEPVSAVPLSPMQTAWRWAQQRPGVAALVLLSVTSLLVGVAGVTWQWRQAEAARRGESQALGQATATVVDLYTHSGISAAQAGDPTRAALWFAKAAAASPDPARQAEELRRQMAWSMDLPTVVRAFDSGIGQAGGIRWNSAQTAVALEAIRGKRSAIWNLAGEERWRPPGWEKMECARWAPKSGWIAWSDGTNAHLVEFPSGREFATVPGDSQVISLAVSPDERWLAVASSVPYFWEIGSGRKTPLPASIGTVTGLEFSRNGRYVLLTSRTHRGACDLSVPGDFLSPPVEAALLGDAGFLGDGESFFSARAGQLRVFETATGRKLEEYSTSTPADERVRCASPDGRLIATFSRAVLQRGEGELNFPKHKNRFEAVDFSSDGRWLASGAYDATLRLWRTDGKGEGRRIGWHQFGVTAVAFSPDQRFIASAQGDHSLIRIWKLGEAIPSQEIPVAGKSAVRVSPGGQLFAPIGWTAELDAIRRTRVYQTSDAKPAGPEIDPGGVLFDAQFAPDESWLATVSVTAPARPWKNPSPGAGLLQFWDFRRGARLGEPVSLPAEPRGLAVHPSGEWIGLYDARGQLTELNVKTREGRTLAALSSPPRERTFARCRYSPDGSLLAAWGLNTGPLFYDRQASQLRQPEWPAPLRVLDVTFHGSILAAVPLESRIEFLTVPELKRVVAPIQDADWLFVGRFSPDGEHFLSGGRSSLARLWDWRRGALQCPALRHDDEVFAATFIPDSDWVATGSIDGHIRFWNRHTGLPSRPALAQGSKVMDLQATPDGRTLIRGNYEGGEVRLYRVADLFPAATLPPADAVLLGEIEAAAEILQGGLEPLTAPIWLAKWKEFRARQPGWHRW